MRSAPGDGSVLDRAPEALTLSFTESVEREATHVDIVDGDGRRFAPTSIAVRGGDDTESPSDVVVGLPNLPPNTYHITWRTLSSDDLHATTGNLVIGVQRAVTAAEPAKGPDGPAPLETVLRALVLLGLCTALGGLALAALLSSTADWPLRRPLLDTVITASLVAVIAAPALLAAQLPAGATGMLAREVFSGRWLLREAGLITLAAAAARLRARMSRTASPPLAAALFAALGAGAAGLGTALLGHAGGQGWLDVAAASVHVLAAGGWAGSVIAAAIALVPLIRRDERRARPAAALLRAFSALAVTCLTTLAVTGLLMTGVQVSTVDVWLTTPYGWLLLGKVTVVLFAGLLGARTARRLRRRVGGVPRRGLIGEAVALDAAVTLAAALASAGPANGPQFTRPGSRPPIVPQVTGQVGDLVDTLAIRPNRPGRNVVTIAVNDTRRPALGPITGVSLVLHGPDGNQRVHPPSRGPATATGPSRSTTSRRGGTWTVSVIVARDGLPPLTDVHPWTVGDASAAAGPVVSDAPLQPVTIALAAGLILLLAMVGVGWQRRTHRTSRSGPAVVPDKVAGHDAKVDGGADVGGADVGTSAANGRG